MTAYRTRSLAGARIPFAWPSGLRLGENRRCDGVDRCLLRSVAMLPSEVRAYLLAQHHVLRTQLATCGAEARRLLAGEPRADELRRALIVLRRGFALHNETEQAWLEPLLRRSEAVGPIRIARMLEEHVAEHAAFTAMLVGTDRDVAARMADIIEDIEAHMAAEERTFLSVAVLRDEPQRLP